MKLVNSVYVVVSLLSAACISVAQASHSGSQSLQLDLVVQSPMETPAQQAIAAAKQQIELHPRKVQGFNDLAVAFLKRARETADPK